MYEEFQKIYDESVGRDTDKKKVEDRTQNRGWEEKMVRF